MPASGQTKSFELVPMELFDAGYKELAAKYPGVVDAFNNIMWTLTHSAHKEGERAPAFPDRDIRLLKTRATRRFPSVRVLYEIIGDRVHLWSAVEAESKQMPTPPR